MVLTLKFSDWSVAERLPEFVRRVRGWGYRDVRTRQLVPAGRKCASSHCGGRRCGGWRQARPEAKTARQQRNARGSAAHHAF